MSQVKWIKITVNMFDDEKIRFIETLPDGDTIIVIWLKILTIAGRSNKDGFIMLTDSIPYTEEMLRSYLNRKETIIKLALETFKKLGMIEVVDEQYMLVSSWQKHQSVAGMERIKELNRERQARYREKQKHLLLEDKEKEEDKELDIDTNNVNNNVMRNVTGDVTTRKEKTLTAKDQQHQEKIDEILSTYGDDLKRTVEDYEQHRKDIKQKMTLNAKKLMLMELEKLANDDMTKIAIIEQSIMNNWKGVFPLKNNKANYNNKPQDIKEWQRHQKGGPGHYI